MAGTDLTLVSFLQPHHPSRLFLHSGMKPMHSQICLPTNDELYCSAQLYFHVTPYQFDAKERPWIRSEILEFCQQMQQCNIETSLKR